MINVLGWGILGAVITAVILKRYWHLSEGQFISLLLTVFGLALAIFLITIN